MTFPDLITYLEGLDAEHTAENGYGAMILYDNLAAREDAEISTDSEATGWEAVQLFNWRPTNSWKPASSGTHYVDVDLDAPALANSFAFARYVLGDPDATIVLRSSDDGVTYVDCFPAIRLGDWQGRPKMIGFADITAQYWRVEVASAVAPSAIAVVAFGPTYWPKYAQLVGFKMIKTARDVRQYTATSDQGLMLGRTKLSVVFKGSITFEHMTENELLFEWSPFLEHAEDEPFFIAPLLTHFPDEVAFAQLDGEFASPAYVRHRRFSPTLPMIGVCP